MVWFRSRTVLRPEICWRMILRHFEISKFSSPIAPSHLWCLLWSPVELQSIDLIWLTRTVGTRDPIVSDYSRVPTLAVEELPPWSQPATFFRRTRLTDSSGQPKTRHSRESHRNPMNKKACNIPLYHTGRRGSDDGEDKKVFPITLRPLDKKNSGARYNQGSNWRGYPIWFQVQRLNHSAIAASRTTGEVFQL